MSAQEVIARYFMRLEISLSYLLPALPAAPQRGSQAKRIGLFREIASDYVA